MSINIFGSSGGGGGYQSSGVDQKYVDHKFATLNTNLATKVNKNGDLMSGDLNMGDSKFVIFVILKKTKMQLIKIM